jgi:hypothetical protein
MPRQTRKKKGGNNLAKLENAIQQQKNDNDLENDNKQMDGGEMNQEEQELNLDTKEMGGGELNEVDHHNTNNRQLDGGENLQMDGGENNSKGFLDNGFSMIKNAVKGFTGGNRRKVGGATPLQSKLFTSLNARSQKLNETMRELHGLQKNLNAKTNNVSNEVAGLQNLFKQYNKMTGGRKSHRRRHKKHKKHKSHKKHKKHKKHSTRRRYKR